MTEQNEKKKCDLVIIGAGPAGFAAGIYAGRSGLDTVLLDMMGGGGQVNIIDRVENYPGVPDIDSGAQLADLMRKQAEKFGVTVTFDQAERLEPGEDSVTVHCSGTSYEARAVLIASGSRHKPLGVPGEGKLMGKGVSVCATCDGPFFKGKKVAVVGGGSSAVMEALYLTNVVDHVTLIHRRDKLRAEKILQDRFLAAPNQNVLWDTVVEEILGEDQVTGLRVKNLKTGESSVLDVAAVFIFVGLLPNSDFARGVVDVDDWGFIKVDMDMRTSHPRIFAAGDVRIRSARQIGTAVGDGITAAVKIQEMLDTETPKREFEKSA
ncbi:MAG: thioredoxin-disulfide reductase [Deltaproteobacteria bacterium]|nr:MAG: thioredoxin-disulfide reductase [Deltaproteobacteria bacterium]